MPPGEVLLAWKSDKGLRNPVPKDSALVGLLACHSYIAALPRFVINRNNVGGGPRRISQCLLHTVHASAIVQDATELADSVADPVEQPAIRPEVFVTDDEVKAVIAQETGRDRLRAMFSKNINNEMSGDLSTVVQITSNCSFMFFLITSVFGGKSARERFVEKNKATKYTTKFMAFRSYNDAIVFGGLKTGLLWGFKSALFTGSFMLITQTVAVYRNRTSIGEYVLAGALTCALLRITMGPRGMFGAGVIGSALGLVGGACFCAILYATEQTQQHRHFRSIHNNLCEKREVELLVKSKSDVRTEDDRQQTPLVADVDN